MTFNLGLNVVEVDGRVAPSIQAAPTSVAAFIVRAERGLENEVYRLTNWSEYVEHFGSFMAGAFGAYAVRGFFDNGGSVAYVTRVMDTATAAAATVDLDGGGAAALSVTAGYRGEEDPGTWGNNIAIQIRENSEDTNAYDLLVHHNGFVVETWGNLNLGGTAQQNPATVINDEFSGSKYIIVEVPVDVTVNPDETVDADDNVVPVLLANGADGPLTGTDLQNALAGALSRFDIYDVQLVCSPENDETDADTAVFANAALTYCAARGDCMFVGHTPFNQDAAATKAYGKEFQGDKVYGALYFPWIRVADPIGTQKWIPPTGHIMGVYARTEQERGIWKAPAGNAARVNNALDIQHQITSAVHTDLVKNGSVNAVRYIPGQGIVIDSSRTLSTNPIWLYVNVRLLFNFVKSSLMSGLRWVVQEPNDQTLWNKAKFNSINPFLMGLWRRGAFGAGLPEEVFTVKIDNENNSAASIQQGILNIEVYFYPVRPAETIVITVGQQESGAFASES